MIISLTKLKENYGNKKQIKQLINHKDKDHKPDLIRPDKGEELRNNNNNCNNNKFKNQIVCTTTLLNLTLKKRMNKFSMKKMTIINKMPKIITINNNSNSNYQKIFFPNNISKNHRWEMKEYISQISIIIIMTIMMIIMIIINTKMIFTIIMSENITRKIYKNKCCIY